MDMIADILLVAGALGAGLYCFVLARRLSKFNDLEGGVGGAVAVLSAQVDDLTRTLKAAQVTADHSNTSLTDLTDRAEGVAKRLELLVASMHDLPEAESRMAARMQPTPPPAPTPAPQPMPSVASAASFSDAPPVQPAQVAPVAPAGQTPAAQPGIAADVAEEEAPIEPIFKRHAAGGFGG